MGRTEKDEKNIRFVRKGSVGSSSSSGCQPNEACVLRQKGKRECTAVERNWWSVTENHSMKLLEREKLLSKKTTWTEQKHEPLEHKREIIVVHLWEKGVYTLFLSHSHLIFWIQSLFSLNNKHTLERIISVSRESLLFPLFSRVFVEMCVDSVKQLIHTSCRIPTVITHANGLTGNSSL